MAMRPYYEREGVTLYHGDCLEILPALVSAPVDCVITSPPYNLGGEPWPHLGHWKPGDGGAGSKSKWRNGSDACGGVNYSGHDDAMPHVDYVAWQHRVLRECWRVLSDDGAIFYNHKPRVIGAKLWLPLELNPGLPLRQIVIWARAGGMNFNPTAYVPTHEWIMIFAKEGFRLRDKAASGFGDVWSIPQDGKNPHPAAFPLELPRRILKSIKARTVLDPFAGSGTTLTAALKAGRQAVGIEIDERYCEIAARRCEAARTPLFDGAPS
jgi:site-specific DNA-methyltransferase (adenine-specific)